MATPPSNPFTGMMNNPLFAAGMQMLANSGRSLQPRSPFEGIPQVLMQQQQQAMMMKQFDRQQSELDRQEEERKATQSGIKMIGGKLAEADKQAGNYGENVAANIIGMEGEPADIQAMGPLMPNRPAPYTQQQQLADMMASGSPTLGASALATQMKPETFTAVPAGGTAYGSQGTKLEGQPKLVTPTKGQKIASSLGQLPGTPEYNKTIQEFDKPVSMSVTVDNKQQLERNKIDDKYYGGMYQGLQEEARGSSQRTLQYRTLESMLKDVDWTGAGATKILSLKKIGKLLGLDVNDKEIASAEGANALANEIALQLRNPGAGAGMPGAMSDKDREFLVSMVPGIMQTPRGRELMVQVRRRLDQRAADVAKLARTYKLKNKWLDEGFEQELYDKFYSNTSQDMFIDLMESNSDLLAPPTTGRVEIPGSY